MDKMINQTMPVIVENKNTSIGCILGYGKEGEVMRTIACANEQIADKYIREYARTGSFAVPNMLSGLIEVYDPDYLLKMQVTRVFNKEYRVVTLPDPSIIES